MPFDLSPVLRMLELSDNARHHVVRVWFFGGLLSGALAHVALAPSWTPLAAGVVAAVCLASAVGALWHLLSWRDAHKRRERLRETILRERAARA